MLEAVIVLISPIRDTLGRSCTMCVSASDCLALCKYKELAIS